MQAKDEIPQEMKKLRKMHFDLKNIAEGRMNVWAADQLEAVSVEWLRFQIKYTDQCRLIYGDLGWRIVREVMEERIATQFQRRANAGLEPQQTRSTFYCGLEH